MSRGIVYKHIAEYLRNAIASGELKVGDAVYSENLLCEKFKVSRTSVRKAIRQMVDENLLVSRQGLGTFVKSSGHGLIHHAVCMVNHWERVLRYDCSDTYYMDMVYGAEEAVNSRSLNFQLFSGRLSGEEDIKSKMGHVKVDGVLVDGAYQAEGEVDYIRRLTPHAVLVDGDPTSTRLPVVAPDAQAGFRELLKLGIERGGTVFYLYEDIHTINRWRLECFRKALKSLKYSRVVMVNYGELVAADNLKSVDHYYLICMALERALAAHPDCRTVIADSDHAGVKAMNYLKRGRYSIPGDIGVSGFAGMAISGMVEPSLTTVHVDSRRMAAAAVDFLIDQIEGNAGDKIRLVPVKLLRRNSL